MSDYLKLLSHKARKLLIFSILLGAVAQANSVQIEPPAGAGPSVGKLVAEFNRELSRMQPDFAVLQDKRNTMENFDRSVAEQMEAARNVRAARISETLQQDIRHAIEENRIDSARSLLSYISRQQTYLNISFDDLLEYEKSVQRMVEVADDTASIAALFKQIDAHLAENKIGAAYAEANVAKVKFDDIKDELKRSQRRLIKKKLEQKIDAITSKEQNLVDANLRILRTQGSEPAIRFRKNIISQARISQQKRRELDDAIAEQAQREQFRRDSIKAVEVRRKAVAEENRYLQQLKQEQSRREQRRLKEQETQRLARELQKEEQKRKDAVQAGQPAQEHEGATKKKGFFARVFGGLFRRDKQSAEKQDRRSGAMSEMSAGGGAGFEDIVLNNIFRSGKWRLKKAARARLDSIAEVIQAHPGISLEICGYTDNIGNAQSNLKLSYRRALAVYNYLVKKGVPAQRLKAFGRGEENPIDSNATPTGRARNRRVEITRLN
ncbi:MAG: OmpA family protein [Chitinivibrionales bacterium]|nr:OmpA family protein [Chitinivibrionales bacterium]